MTGAPAATLVGRRVRALARNGGEQHGDRRRGAATHICQWCAGLENAQQPLTFELGSFYYLANDPQVPANVRATYQKYGLCADGE